LEQTTQYAIITRDLTKTFGRGPKTITAVDHLNLRVLPGTLYGFLGPNGAGKTTTLKMLTGLLRPTGGTAIVAGFDVVQDPLEVKRRIGVVPETLHLYERLTADEYLELVGRLYSLDLETIRRRREQLLEGLDLADAADNMIVDYSHGMKKKLSLAAALLHRPQILFLDEPFEGVDAVSARVIKDLLTRMAVNRGVTIFFSTHIMELVERLCDRVAIINKGKLIAEGDLTSLRDQVSVTGDASLEEVFLQLVEAKLGVHSLDWLFE